MKDSCCTIQSWYSGNLPQFSSPFSMLLLFNKDSFENASHSCSPKKCLGPILDTSFKGAEAFHDEKKMAGDSRVTAM